MKTDQSPRTRVRFGTFEADLRSGELHRKGLKVKIQELPFQVLVALLEKPGEVVTREDLRTRLWPADTFVDFEQGLNRAINKLREALGDDANNPRFVETLTRRGYRFIGPMAAGTGFPERRSKAVRIIALGFSAILVVLGVLLALNVAGLRNRLLGRAMGTPTIHSIAVLPLENLSGDPNQEYFADGMTDELITELSKIAGLRVIARTSVMRYKGTRKPLPEIAHELNVDAVIEGSVLRSGDRVRINAQLVDVSTKRNLWAQTYDRKLGNVLALYSDVAEAIAEKIQVRVTPQEMQRLQAAQTINPAAYDAYLRGRYLVDRRSDTPRSTQYFRKAIGLDPNYAAAYAGLSMSLVSQGYVGAARPDDVIPQARAAARHALQLNPDLGEAYTALGAIEISYNWDWKAAEQNLKRGIELSTSDPIAEIFYTFYLNAVGRPVDAVAHAQKAVKLDPVSFFANRNLAAMLYFARRYDAALVQLQRTRELREGTGGIENWMTWIYEKKGMYDEAVRADLKLRGIEGVLAANVDSCQAAYARSGWRGYWKERIKRAVPRAKGQCVPYLLGVSYARIGDLANAFRWLNRAVDQHCVWVTGLPVDPKLDVIRSDPRFQALLHRMNLPK